MNAVITGAGKGIGREISLSLARAGYNLAICSRTISDLILIKEEVSKIDAKLEVFYMKVELGQKEEVVRFSNFVKKSFTEVNVLVNNAGVFKPGRIIGEAEGNLEETININLYAAYHLTRNLISLVKGSRNAHIFNMCSIASFMAYPNGGSYSISKFALLGFSKVLREELKSEMVKVTAILPGATWSHSWEGADFPDDRLMKASDIAEVVMSALRLSPSAVVEEITIRPQLGDV